VSFVSLSIGRLRLLTRTEPTLGRRASKATRVWHMDMYSTGYADLSLELGMEFWDGVVGSVKAQVSITWWPWVLNMRIV